MLATVVSALVLHATLRGSINPATEDYLRMAIGRAETEHARALIVELDTPGGLLTSVHRMAEAIDDSAVPVIVYVTPAGATATSAGALLALSAHLAAMTPGTNLGAAHPVDGSGKGIEGVMGDKVLNDTVKFAESMADLRGRNRAVAGEIVSKSRSLTANEALDLKIVEVLASSERELLRKIDGRIVHLKKSGDVKLAFDFAPISGAPSALPSAGSESPRIEAVAMTLGQTLLQLLSNPNVAAILSTLAMLLIYIELKSPGIQVAGILGLLCLIVSFMAFQTLPIRVGGLVLLFLGLAGMVAEVFAATHGALAVAGVASFVFGMIWVIDPAQSSWAVSPAIWAPAGLGLGGMMVWIGIFAQRAAADSAAARIAIGGTGPLGLEGYRGQVDSVAADGRTGKLVIRGETWNFRSDESIGLGDSVEVVNATGFLLNVRRIKNNL